MSLAATLVSLPDELKAAIAIGVLFLVRTILDGRVPDKFISELAAVITTALITVINLALGMVPPQFEAVATAVLHLIAVLLGSILFVNAYRMVRAGLHERGLRA